MRKLSFSIAALFIFLFGACKKDSMQADLIISGARIYAFDSLSGRYEALAVREGRILALGSHEEIMKMKGPGTRMIELHGETLLPGLIEGHGHFLSMGRSLRELNLLDTRSYREIIDSVRERLKGLKAGEWLRGRGWHQEKWDEVPGKSIKGFPVHDPLSAISPDHPVILHHASGHAILVNQKAMEIAGITDETPDPPGGVIVRDENGHATGIFEENAEYLITDKYEEYLAGRTEEEKKADFEKTLQLAEAHCLENGITAFHDAASTIEEIKMIRAYHKEKGLKLRLDLMLYGRPDELITYLDSVRPDDASKPGFLFVNSVKLFYDGALGSRGALMLEPYSDDPGNTGQRTIDTADFYRIAEKTAIQGYQLCTHAIGDRANHEVLNAYEQIYAKYPESSKLRWRIEHAQHIAPDDQPRFAALPVIAAMQSIHCSSDAPFVIARLGEERARQGAYVWRNLIDRGVLVMEGTDVPVERLDPMANIYAGVTRRQANGKAFFPEQAKTREEELRSYTLVNAYGLFMDPWKGSLEKGKVADFTIIDKDLMNCPEEDIRKARVLYTIINGKILYRNE